MKRQKYSVRRAHIFGFLKNYIIMFLLISFAVTCSMLLFLQAMDIEFADIEKNAMLTFGNIFLITAIVCTIDGIRRYIFIELPLQKLLDATYKITRGDFSVRIKMPRFVNRDFLRIINAFNKMAEELSGIETLRTDFISNVSHEIKTPLAVMQNYSSLLASTDLSDRERIEYAGKIAESSKRLSGLVSNILKLNKLENQSIFPLTEDFDLSEQICECLLDFESIWEEKQIELDIQIEENITVRSDPELLSLVWHNLLSNAFKFTENGGKVSVILRRMDDKILFSVSDTGCGMDADTGAHIFEKFYQGDTSHATLGNGLGLPLVKRVIDITGSDINVESRLGDGSTFTVILSEKKD